MTCGLAVKRPHDYEAYLSPDVSVEVKRPRPLHCSPFRPQLGTLAASLPSGQSPNSTNGFSNVPNSAPDSPFAIVAGKCQLSKNQLEDYLRAEVRYLKRRRLIPRRFGDNQESDENTVGSSNSYRRGGTSPASSISGSDSEGEQHSSGKSNFINELYGRPQFSMNQVKMICERLLKEQETRLRYEYETVLNHKLEEKHQEYVQFAREQLETRPSSAEYSYLS
jgi:hypothetical protein